MIDVSAIDQVTQQFLTPIRQDAMLLQKAGTDLFYGLMTLQIAINGIQLALAGEPLERFLIKLIQLTIAFAFFYGLILYGGRWIPDILNGFIQVGQQGGVSSIDPGSVLAQGLSIAGAILNGFFNWGLLSHPFVSLCGTAVCIGIVIIYGLIAADLSVTLVKTYFIVATSGLFFAFGASEFTREMAIKYFRAIIGLGLQLMTLYLLLDVGQNIGSNWAQMTAQAAQNHELMPMFVIMGAVIVYYIIIKNIPPFVAGLAGVSGFRNYGDAAVGMALNAGFTGARWLSNTTQAGGSGIQMGTQGLQNVVRVGKSFGDGYRDQDHKNYFDKVAGGLKTAASHTSSSTFNTVKDLAMRRNQDMTIGQKFHHHITNKIKKAQPEE